MKLDYFLTPYTKINSKWIKGLNVKLDKIKFLEENMGRRRFGINNSKIFFDPPTRVIKIKAKINKSNLVKCFCTAEETINNMKRQPSEWEKILVMKQLTRD